MADTPKRIKRVLREYAGAAHEEELRRVLGSGELSEIIHRFHQGPARDLYVRYDTDRLEMAVAYAITVGILDRRTIQFYEREQATP
jgi:hypothetical protein